ncbi:MAG TPA: CDP-alcohol phosphatidyltransferase family protein [Candidatus Limnocylindrales bacterium]|jgi:CDP-L-myo-inositol myo-inositolphosphotransferase
MSGSSPEGPVSRFLNRRLSRPLARLLAPTFITPNQVSFASFLIALAALACFALDQPIAAGALIQTSSVVDGVDGDLARLQGRASRFGAVFDAFLDRYADGAIVAGMAWWAWANEDWPQPFLVGLLALTGFLIVSYSRARLEGEGFHAALSGANMLASRDVRLLLAAIGSAIGQAYWTLVVLGALCYAIVALRLWLASRSPPPARYA